MIKKYSNKNDNKMMMKKSIKKILSFYEVIFLK